MGNLSLGDLKSTIDKSKKLKKYRIYRRKPVIKTIWVYQAVPISGNCNGHFQAYEGDEKTTRKDVKDYALQYYFYVWNIKKIATLKSSIGDVEFVKYKGYE